MPHYSAQMTCLSILIWRSTNHAVRKTRLVVSKNLIWSSRIHTSSCQVSSKQADHWHHLDWRCSGKEERVKTVLRFFSHTWEVFWWCQCKDFEKGVNFTHSLPTIVKTLLILGQQLFFVCFFIGQPTIVNSNKIPNQRCLALMLGYYSEWDSAGL